jgi:hypothetical protein
MPLSLRPAPGVADPSHRAVARQRAALAARELTQVRAAALAWSKGMAAVLAGLLGFSLIKGRTDVGSLSGGYALIVGALLLLAIGAGGAATWNLLSAAYGRPIKMRLSQMRDKHWSQLAAEHAEALSAGKALNRGLLWGISCVALLILAVGTTWYGPAKDEPRLLVTTVNGLQCGEVIGFAHGTVTLRTSEGQIRVDLATASWVKAVDACPESTR